MAWQDTARSLTFGQKRKVAVMKPKTPCVEHVGTKVKGGYGRVYYDGRMQLAHRVAWQKANGPIPEGFVVCHRCDNPPCINADHLFVGTQTDNMADMAKKGRGKNARGEKHYITTLSERDVECIREFPKYYGYAKVLSQQYGVTTTTIRNIRAGRTWSGKNSQETCNSVGGGK